MEEGTAKNSLFFLQGIKSPLVQGFGVVIVLIILAMLLLRMFSPSVKKINKNPEQVVVTQKAKTANIPVILNALGQVTPTDTVTIKSQVNGVLQKVLFKEGQMIKAGYILAQIDERPFQAQLTQYLGQLAHDLAQLSNAKVDLERYELLWKEDSVSKQTLDTQRSLVSQLEGTVKADQGLIETAKVNLAYCRISSPINGRIGLRLVDPGNFVQTSDTSGLFVINNVRPITVVFTIPEDNVPQVMQQIKKGKKLKCEAYDRTQTSMLAKGTLLTMDNQIDPTTGTVKLKAQFKNEDDSLFPNQFVNIKLFVSEIENAIIIPTSGILHGAQGDYVYKLEKDNRTVKLVNVKAGIPWGEYTAITEGISSEDNVVVEGTDKLTNGSLVKATTEPKSKAQ